MKHAKGITAITNPLVNSFERLVPGYEAPTEISWSMKNRSPLVRVPAKRGDGTRIELRSPDPSANPYLALAVMLAAGLDGVSKRMQPPEPVNKNLYTMYQREKSRLRIGSLPGSLMEALHLMDKDPLMKEALGGHIYRYFYDAKMKEWELYIQQVHTWEQNRYLSMY